MSNQKHLNVALETNEKTNLPEVEQKKLSETWPDDALADLADYIEEQGVYIRQ